MHHRWSNIYRLEEFSTNRYEDDTFKFWNLLIFSFLIRPSEGTKLLCCYWINMKSLTNIAMICQLYVCAWIWASIFSLNFALLFKRKYKILIKSRPFFNSCTSPIDSFDCAKIRIKMLYVYLVVLCSVVLLSVVGCSLYCRMFL